MSLIDKESQSFVFQCDFQCGGLMLLLFPKCEGLMTVV